MTAVCVVVLGGVGLLVFRWPCLAGLVVRVDPAQVPAHEIGHVLILRHSGDPSALMAPFYVGSRRFLAPDDISGIRED
jgi:hypothetical protein